MLQRWRWLLLGVLIMGYASLAYAEVVAIPPSGSLALEASADLPPAVSAAMDAAVSQATAQPSAEAVPAAEASPAADAPAGDPFAKGARYWSVTAGASRDASLGTISLAQLHINYYVTHRLAVLYGGMFGYVNTNRTPAGVFAGPDVGLRWYWLQHGRWSTYAEGLAGMLLQTQPLTEESLRFNFDLQPGTGASYRLNDRTLVQGGFRWHHLSNARVRGKAHNFGYDAPLVYVELMKAF